MTTRQQRPRVRPCDVVSGHWAAEPCPLTAGSRGEGSCAAPAAPRRCQLSRRCGRPASGAASDRPSPPPGLSPLLGTDSGRAASAAHARAGQAGACGPAEGYGGGARGQGGPGAACRADHPAARGGRHSGLDRAAGAAARAARFAPLVAPLCAPLCAPRLAPLCAPLCAHASAQSEATHVGGI